MAKGDDRLFIVIEGGIVQEVYGSNPDTCVTVIDDDILENGDDNERRDHEDLTAEMESIIKSGQVKSLY